MDSLSKADTKSYRKILCPTHKKPVSYLNTAIHLSKKDSILKCESCISKELSTNFTLKKTTKPHILIDDIDNSNNPFQLDSWYIEFNQGQWIPLLDFEQEDFKVELNQFIKSFRSRINNNIDLFQQEIIKRYQELEQNRQKMLSYAQKISYFSEIKTIIQKSSDFGTLAQQLNDQRKILQSQKPNIDNNLQILIDNLNFYTQYLNLNSLKFIETVVDDVFTKFQNQISSQLLDMVELENDKIKRVQENVNFNDKIVIGYQIECLTQDQILNKKDLIFYKNNNEESGDENENENDGECKSECESDNENKIDNEDDDNDNDNDSDYDGEEEEVENSNYQLIEITE